MFWHSWDPTFILSRGRKKTLFQHYICCMLYKQETCNFIDICGMYLNFLFTIKVLSKRSLEKLRNFFEKICFNYNIINHNVLIEQKCFTKTAIKDVTEPIFPPSSFWPQKCTNYQWVSNILNLYLFINILTSSSKL